MKSVCSAIVLAMTTTLAAAQVPVATPPALAPSPALTQAMISAAVRETLAEEKRAQAESGQPAMQQVTIRADKYEQFAAAFSEAKVPDCLHPDGLKRQPTNLGPVGVVGVYALPFVAIARLRGKCN
ncbi:hypothetical protein [Janthinobacterium sp. J1-1]|uniref:hypothetical protein n=1 Tax=unclassified Janthinobacterium TaxID=2610881 RepID=UPI002810D5CE|nr:hypothetical protein [Janthinobacterium sp. J1-1]